MLKCAAAGIIVVITTLGCSSIVSKKVSSRDSGVRLSRSWSRQTVQGVNLSYRHPASISPVLYKDLVIEGNSVDGLRAYYKKSGHIAWKLDLKFGLEGLYLEAGKLYFGANNGKFYQVDAQSGTILWSFPIQSESTSSPLVRGNFIFHMAMNGSLYAFEKESGRVLWVKTRPAREAITIRGSTQPVFHNGRIYVGHSDGYFVSYNATNGERMWQQRLADNKKFNDIDARPVVTKACVLVANYSDTLYCLSQKSGQIIWKVRNEGGFQPISTDSKNVYYSSMSAILVVDGKTGKVLREFKVAKNLGHPTTALPYEKWLIAGYSEGPIVIMDKLTGKVEDQFSPGRGVMAPPTLDSKTGDVYFISKQANLYKLKVVKSGVKGQFQWSRH